ncbi:hypothetical protein KEJ31_04920 [Candidatus Bathyarchaeota archaeon]|nr:hypothetical protein [Candidatus Bathyarchaeota archaeon]
MIYSKHYIKYLKDWDALESISVEKCSLRSGAGIRRSEFYPVSDIYFSQYLLIREYLAGKRGAARPWGVNCKSCARYIGEKCVGCPATTDYEGSL